MRKLKKWLLMKSTLSGIGVLVSAVVMRLPLDADIKGALLSLIMGFGVFLISNIGEH